MKISRWSKTSTTNLVKYLPTGTYYIRAKINGRVVHESLGTTRKALAVEKLMALMQSRRGVTADTMTVQQAMRQWLDASDRAHNIKQRTKDYHHELADTIAKTWPDMDQEVHRVRAAVVLAWAAQEGVVRYSAPRYNALCDTLRAIFSTAIEAGAIFRNPAEKLTKRPVVLKEPCVPNPETLQKILDKLAERKSHAGRLCRFLAYSGMRIGEASALTWAMVDREHRQFRLPAGITKSGRARIVPILPQMEGLLKELEVGKQDRPGHVLPITTVKVVLKEVLREMTLPHMTHHTFRHLFTTYCLNHGVDVPTVAKWRGDSDGGAMMLKIYSHLLDSHSQQMAEGLRF